MRNKALVGNVVGKVLLKNSKKKYHGSRTKMGGIFLKHALSLKFAYSVSNGQLLG